MTGDPKEMSKNDLVREVKRLRAMLSDQLSAAPGVGRSIEVVGIVGLRDGEPIVTMRAGEAAWQLTLDQAREHAMDTLAAACEAERDAATVDFCREAGMADAEVGGYLMMLREHRTKWMRENAVAA